MKQMIARAALVLLLAVSVVQGQTAQPENAESILKAAVQEAGASGKNIFLIFHASWCGWCRRLDAALESPEIKKALEQDYVVVRLDVLENGDKKQSLENPGAQGVMSNLGGAKSGLPFYAFLDGAGQRLANSNVMPNNGNIGYPGSPEEITAFENLLRQTSSRLSDEQRGQIVAYLKKNAPH